MLLALLKSDVRWLLVEASSAVFSSSSSSVKLFL